MNIRLLLEPVAVQKLHPLGTFLIGALFLTQSLSVHAADLTGVFMIVKGDVKIQPKSGGTPAVAKVGSKLGVGDTVLSGPDSRGKIVMSDRNVINISPDTKFLLAKYDSNPVTGDKNVEMQVLAGKVRNNVEQTYDGEKSKFIVKTPTAVAGVRGTQFVTGFNPTTQATSVVTLKGAVSFAAVNPAGQTIGSPVTIQKGETASSSGNAAPEPPKAVPKEELKKMDAETTASQKSPSDGGNAQGGSGTAVAAKGEGETGKSEQGSGDRGPASEGPGGPSGPSSPDGGNAPGGEAIAGPDMGGPMGAPSPGAMGEGAPMIDAKDMDLGMAREIKNPVTASAPPPPPPTANLPRPPVNVPPVNPVLTEIIRKTNMQTTLIIRPVPTN